MPLIWQDQKSEHTYLDKKVIETEVPQPSLQSLKIIDFKSISLSLPWSGSPNIKSSGVTLVASYDKKRSVAILPGNEIMRTLASIDETNGINAIKMYSIEGETNYSLYKWIINLTPEDIHLLTKPTIPLIKQTLFVYKPTTIASSSDGNSVYSFTTKNNIRGFYTSTKNGSVLAEIFDKDDNQYLFIIKAESLDEAYFILNSIRNK